jgi:hypothetical protein
MKKKRVALIGASAIVFLTPVSYYCFFALVRHEHFFRGLPTSHWERAIIRWHNEQSNQPPSTIPYFDTVTTSLGFRGEPAVLRGGRGSAPVLLDLLDSEDPVVRLTACGNLTFFAYAQSDIPTLVQAANAKHGDVLIPILQTLSLFGPRAREVVPRLIQLLSDQDSRLRQEAAEVLASLGPVADDAIAALCEAQRDSQWQVREAATDALEVIAPQALGTLSPCARISRLLRQNRREYFRTRPPNELLLISGWIQALPSGEMIHRATLQTQAQPIVGMGREAVPELLKWVQAPEWHVRYIAIYSLQEITGLEPYTPYFDDEDREKNRPKAIVVWKDWYDSQRPSGNATKCK